MQKTKVDSMSVSDLTKLKVALKSTKIRYRKDLIETFLGYLNSPDAPADAYSYAMKGTIIFAWMRRERSLQESDLGLSDRQYDGFIMREKVMVEAIRQALL